MTFYLILIWQPLSSGTWASHINIKSLWPSDAIWPHWYALTLAQVKFCCVPAPSHYLEQFWLIINVFCNTDIRAVYNIVLSTPCCEGIQECYTHWYIWISCFERGPVFCRQLVRCSLGDDIHPTNDFIWWLWQTNIDSTRFLYDLYASIWWLRIRNNTDSARWNMPMHGIYHKWQYINFTNDIYIVANYTKIQYDITHLLISITMVALRM